MKKQFYKLIKKTKVYVRFLFLLAIIIVYVKILSLAIENCRKHKCKECKECGYDFPIVPPFSNESGW